MNCFDRIRFNPIWQVVDRTTKVVYNSLNRINKSRPEGVTSTRRALTRDTKGTRAMATPYSSISPSDNQTDLLDQTLSAARFICADPVRVQYWAACYLALFAGYANTLIGSIQFANPADLLSLQSASTAATNELRRRDGFVRGAR